MTDQLASSPHDVVFNGSRCAGGMLRPLAAAINECGTRIAGKPIKRIFDAMPQRPGDLNMHDSTRRRFANHRFDSTFSAISQRQLQSASGQIREILVHGGRYLKSTKLSPRKSGAITIFISRPAHADPLSMATPAPVPWRNRL